MWLFLKSTHLVHPITLVHLWKIPVHPEVYDTPGWQALNNSTVSSNKFKYINM